MQYYLYILWAFYLVIAVVVAALVVWNVLVTRKISEKVIGAIVIVMFLLRIFMLK